MKKISRMLAGIFVGGCMIWAGWRNILFAGTASSRQPEDLFDRDTINILESHIPFGLKMVKDPGPHCDPLDMVVLVNVDDQGRDINYRWRVMDGVRVQLECEDFYDLYYRCDAPACYHVRVIKERLSDGRIISNHQGHMCLD